MLKIPDAILMAASTLAAAEFEALSTFKNTGSRSIPHRRDLEIMLDYWVDYLTEKVSKIE
jgi:hypothetical protein